MKTAALLILGVLICMVQAAPKPDTAPDTDELERDKRQLYNTEVGTVYTRWGKRSCPNTGAKLLYAGRVGGSPYDTLGGGSNYLCMPDNPRYRLHYTPKEQGWATIEGVEMESRYGRFENVPCAVCSTPRETTIMIPAWLTCPPGWVPEYSGYLMTAANRNRRTMFECVDPDPDTITELGDNAYDAVLYHVEARCNGLDCPPYNPQKELTCVVCSK